MRRLSLLALVILALRFVPSYGQDRYPRIVFDSVSKDFGRVTSGEILKHVFRFKNQGQAQLEIFQVRPT